MPKNLTRREWMRRSAAAGGLFAAGSLMPVSALANQAAGPEITQAGRSPAKVAGGKVVQPQRELPVLKKTSILVVGGGPAGTAAAFSAKKLGVDVTLVERYGYLGGLAAGGLVLGIFPSILARTNRSSGASAKNS